VGELDDPVVVDLPLRGEWTVEQTPAHRIPSHGTDILGMRYAFDFVRTDHRPGHHVHPAGTLRWLLVGGRTRDCYGWGEPVHAALGGEVTGAVDGVPEHEWVHPVRECAAAVAAARRFGTGREPVDPRALAGNHVVIRTGDVFALYAHLVPGSVAVRSGEHVPAGGVIGRVGHSGNSTAPHLHFQLMDAADARRARGIPCAFADYDVVRGDGRHHVDGGIPGRHERICTPA
jgi:hypothetical protein